MKKEYIKPISETYSVELQSVLAGNTSDLSVSGKDADQDEGMGASKRSWGSLW
jgi:hypothetical protein